LLILLAANLFSTKGQTAEKILKCEKVEDRDWWTPNSFKTIKTCLMTDTTSIDSDGFKISPEDETIEGLRMYSNRKIEFLPEKLKDVFANLLGYSAYECSIKQISYKNFRGLVKLQELYLYSNKIETIPSDAFKDLTALEFLGLSKNHSQ
jgi:Leucine-rich repeat (LRR) protein